MNHDLLKPLAAIVCGCLLGFGLVGMAQQDRQALARCQQRPGATVTECQLIVFGR